MAAMGSLMSHAGPEIEDGSISAESVEALGSLMAELSELSGLLIALQVNCQRGLSQPAG